jgi:ketosteroid isomerase-like protein
VTVVREGFEAFERGDMAWMDQHLADDVVWHVGGNSKWAGGLPGQAEGAGVLRPPGPGNDRTTVDRHPRHRGRQRPRGGAGTASATARDGSSAEWRYTQIFHIRDGKATEVWGMAENDAAVDPSWTACPTEHRRSPAGEPSGVARRYLPGHGSAGTPAGPVR